MLIYVSGLCPAHRGLSQLPCLLEPDLDVMRIDLHRSAETNLLEFGGLRLVGTVLLGLLVLELAEVHDPADRGADIGCDLDEVESKFSRSLASFVGLDDPDHLAVFVDKPDG